MHQKKTPPEVRTPATPQPPQIDRVIRSYGAPLTDFSRVMLYTSSDRVISRFDKESARTKRPFFVFLNLLDSHDLYFPDPAHNDAQAEEKAIRPPHFESDLRTRHRAAEIENPSLITDEKRRAMVSALEKAGHRT